MGSHIILSANDDKVQELMWLSSYHNLHGIKLNMNRINASFYSFEQVIIFNEGKSRSLRKNRRSLLRIITNCSISVTPVRVFTHEFTCRNFDQSETRLVLERDQAKSNFSNSICPSFFVVS